MIRNLPVYFLLFFYSFSFSQVNAIVPRDSISTKQKAFMAGDIVLNANYGIPQVNAFIIKTAIKIYYKTVPDQTMTFTCTNSGVYNVKAEYGVLSNLGLGFAASYWNMNLKIQNSYVANGTNQTDELNLKLAVLALGIRGNYHLAEDLESKVIDPYFGFSIGATKYEKSLDYASTNPDRQIPEWIPPRLYKLKDAWATYISSTFGLRIYPVKYVGLNIEAGWDKGALLFAGAVVRFHSKPIRSLQD